MCVIVQDDQSLRSTMNEMKLDVSESELSESELSEFELSESELSESELSESELSESELSESEFEWYLTWVIHLFEALYALKVCSDKGIDNTSTRLLWFAQTFLYGIASLGLLLKYKPDGRPKRQ
ncbi:Transmembrane protein 254 [Anabarilius grahami]|uniref:Transmembrane protein 254 n=1 Tax=Anabarilius grahami TaxID=495550 RepID=A0A3N0XYH0_ANAGA|nr:Transmembrane protein 254 [Anabarilius grahami]